MAHLRIFIYFFFQLFYDSYNIILQNFVLLLGRIFFLCVESLFFFFQVVLMDTLA